jgi:hypothetical protein
MMLAVLPGAIARALHELSGEPEENLSTGRDQAPEK